MSKLDRRSRAAYRLTALLALAALAKAAVAQEAEEVLAPAAEALGLDSIAVIRFTASGSGYEPAGVAAEGTTAAGWASSPTGGALVENGSEGEPEAGTAEWFEQAAAALVRALNPEPEPQIAMRHFRVVRHVEALDLDAASLRVERERAPGAEVVDGAPDTPGTDDTKGTASSGRVETRIIGAASPWSDRIDYWTHPAAFVAHALSRDATVSRRTIAGAEYAVVSVEAERGRAVHGYVDAEQRLVKITSELLDSAGKPVEVEVSWLRWREFGDLSFPTTIVRKHNGSLVEALIVKSVEVVER